MPGINTSQLLFTLGMDSAIKPLWLTSRNVGVDNPGNVIFTPITKTLLASSDRDKQTEDNLTYLYEYQALLNSRLQALMTKLTNAYAVDLDAAMSTVLSEGTWGYTAMMGATSGTVNDAGAGRTTKVYYGRWGNATGDTGTTDVTHGIAESASVKLDILDSLGAWTDTTVSGGTSSFQNQKSGFVMDRLDVNLGVEVLSNTTASSVLHTTHFEKAGSSSTYRLDQNQLNMTNTEYANSNAKNQFEAMLWREMRKSVNKDIIKFGLMKDIIIATASSLPTGSQVQGTLNLNFVNGYLDIKSDRWSAFYHS